MIFNKKSLCFMNWLVCIFLIGNISSVSAANEVTATTRITATFVVPTCELVMPSTVSLGSIRNGEQSYNPFSIHVNCTTPTDTAIYAQAIGRLDTGSVDTVLMEGSGAKFWLKTDGDPNKLTLNGEAGDSFCGGGINRTCNILPNTLVTPDNVRGETYTVIRFNIRYYM